MNRINNNDSRWKNSFWLGIIFVNFILFIANKFDVFDYVNLKYTGIILGIVIILVFYLAVFKEANLDKFKEYAASEKESYKVLGRLVTMLFWVMGFAVLFFI